MPMGVQRCQAVSAISASAFTLLELLVVISITALLVALLLPALQKARTTVSLTQSLSNLRGIQIALLSYTNDFKAELPFLRWPRDPNDPGYTGPLPGYLGPHAGQFWPSVLHHRDYLSDPRILWSRDRVSSVINLTVLQSSPGNINWAYVSYGMVGDGGYGSRPVYPRMDVIRPAPARTIALAEGWSTDSTLSDGSRPGLHATSPWKSGVFGFARRIYTYDGRAARIYFDGHASGSDSRDIGWDAQAPTLLGTPPGGAYNGDWTYLDHYYYQYFKPWYTLGAQTVLD